MKKFLILALVFALSPFFAQGAFASTAEIQQSISTLRTALSFVNLAPRDKEKLSLLVSDLEVAIGNSKCGETQTPPAVYTVICRLLSVYTMMPTGSAEVSSTTSLQAAFDLAKDTAYEDCRKTNPDRYSCDNSRLNSNYKCYQK